MTSMIAVYFWSCGTDESFLNVSAKTFPALGILRRVFYLERVRLEKVFGEIEWSQFGFSGLREFFERQIFGFLTVRVREKIGFRVLFMGIPLETL